MTPMLAIAAPAFDRQSETFIRDHARTIAPGSTALLCLSENGAAGFDLPVLAGLRPGWRSPGPIHRRLVNALVNRSFDFFGPRFSRKNSRRLFDFLAATRPSAVLAEYGPTGCLLMEICGEADVPLYVHFHGYDASELLRKPHWVRHYRKLFCNAAGIIAPSRFLANKLTAIGCPDVKLHVNPCGIDPARFTPTRRIPQRFLAVGRLVEKKAPHLTIAAFGLIAQRYPQATLDIVGDGPLEERCRTLIASLGLEGRVHMHGVQSSNFVAQLMQDASIFVQHSVTAPNGDTEGLGISILEAMASEIPVIATRHNGFVETIAEGVTGYMVDEHDVTGMAEAMADLLDDPARATAMGIAGRKRVLQYFTLERSRDRLRAIMGFAPLAAIPLAAAETS